ncbi:hypothetical protein BU24DRAFT_219689 [Aaosphaeria arxii CBS 175.79]|uniref:Uncharacterized protein n=1 Tax=Aaosphaeria arxii CBS 175.79 TaxID=1450172 RepID=A0A6A5XNI9_9PLEO|nr:uncharacterized protein BU24DRAFT_219689 [Aaosphaeria arxii CBS 175.79]KAF2014702.1 hypothetical protein BU24DRAFT_219689 [Aaosphaeria arxii CBS 175.79]
MQPKVAAQSVLAIGLGPRWNCSSSLMVIGLPAGWMTMRHARRFFFSCIPSPTAAGRWCPLSCISLPGRKRFLCARNESSGFVLPSSPVEKGGGGQLSE